LFIFSNLSAINTSVTAVKSDTPVLESNTKRTANFVSALSTNWQSWRTASAADWSTALEREAIIRPLAQQLRLSQAIIDDAAKQLRLSRVAVYRLLRRYRERPQTSSLLPWTRGRHSNSRFLSKDREALIATCIRQFYLVKERPSLAALFQEVRRCFAEHQLPTPNYRTVVKRVAAIDPRLAMTKRDGAKAARDKFGPVGVSRLRPERLMEVLQIDHTPVDVIVVDQEQRRPIGRPWLTLAIDVTSRSIAGFNVSLENPSALSVSLVLSHAVLPKETWLADRELHTLDWPMGGLPTSIHVDNAKEFHSEALTRGCHASGAAV
jgi:putative transposase